MFHWFSHLFSRITALFKGPVDEQLLVQLERELLAADIGPALTARIMTRMRSLSGVAGQQARRVLSDFLYELVYRPYVVDSTEPAIYLLVGINGSGKTTTAAKLAGHFMQNNRVALVAADTFRAAAVEQLQLWGDRLGATVISGLPGQDPASVAYAGARKIAAGDCDVLIIDTAGRLHTKTDLMRELAKIRSVLGKAAPGVRVVTLLTIDSTLGQSSLEQVRLFHEATTVDGLILTKADGGGKGGIVCAAVSTFNLPVLWVTRGEQLGDLVPFDARNFVASLVDDQS